MYKRQVGAENAAGYQPRAAPWVVRIISLARPEGARGIHMPQPFTQHLIHLMFSISNPGSPRSYFLGRKSGSFLPLQC